MKNYKINLNRKKLSSDYIKSKQNFEDVLSKSFSIGTASKSILKSGWFYGTIGLSSIAVVLCTSYTKPNEIQIGHQSIAKKQTNTQIMLASASLNQVESNHIQIKKNEVKQVQQAITENKQVEPLVVAENQLKDLKPENKHKIQQNIPATKVNLAEEIAAPTKKSTEIMVVIPKISGVHNGDIAWSDFEKGEIFIDQNITIEKFNINYTSQFGDKTVSVDSATIPKEVIQELKDLGLNQTIFITNIVAKDDLGNLLRCYSMDLDIKF